MKPAALLGLSLLGCLALHPSLQGVRADRCPRGWLPWGGHCYGYFGQELPWRKAEAWCRAVRGGHLASLHSPAEHRALAAFIAQRRRPGEEDEEEEDVWMGLYYRRQSWQWTDGSERGYSAWDGDDAPRAGRCVALEESSRFMSWEEDSCGERKPFVCKLPA